MFFDCSLSLSNLLLSSLSSLSSNCESILSISPYFLFISNFVTFLLFSIFHFSTRADSLQQMGRRLPSQLQVCIFFHFMYIGSLKSFISIFFTFNFLCNPMIDLVSDRVHSDWLSNKLNNWLLIHQGNNLDWLLRREYSSLSSLFYPVSTLRIEGWPPPSESTVGLRIELIPFISCIRDVPECCT